MGFDVTGIETAGLKIGVIADGQIEGNGRLRSHDEEPVQGSPQTLQRLLPVVPPDGHLDQKGVVFRGDFESLVDGAVQPDAGSAG